MADEPRHVGARDPLLEAAEPSRALAHGDEQTVWSGAVHGVPHRSEASHERICHEEEERIGTLAAKEEGVALVGGREGQDGADVVDDALGKEVMGDDRGHGSSFHAGFSDDYRTRHPGLGSWPGRHSAHDGPPMPTGGP